jgi:hypothetical protein
LKRTYISLFLILWWLSGNLFAEQAIFDSLRIQLKKAKNSAEQLEIELNLAYNYLFINADSLRHYANLVIQKSKQTRNYKMLYEGICNIQAYFMVS